MSDKTVIMMAGPEKLKALFEDLGKPTLRGIRKCPKCGTYNGTRGISCKNKNCDVVFKEKEAKKGHSAEAVKIVTGSSVQVFSVRLRDRGPDYRGFVQLPVVQDQEGNPATVVDINVLAQVARCFVVNCSRNVSNSAAGDMTNEMTKLNPCTHIKAAVECTQEAQPLTLKNSILSSLQIPMEMRQTIWLLATETSGPLVQRVTKDIMVVKCKATPLQPLGFLHFAFFETKRNIKQPEYRFQCSCKAFRALKGVPRDDSRKRCVHFYACVCAFASDDKLAEEFAYYIHLDSHAIPGLIQQPSLLEQEQQQEQRQVLTVYQQVDGLDEIADGTATLEVIVADNLLVPPPDKKIKKDESLAGVVAQASSALLTLQEQKSPGMLQSGAIRTSPVKHLLQVNRSQPTPKKADRGLSAPPQLDENQVNLPFHQWLASVTERINQTMHYQFDGNPDPLVFHAPQMMFDCLQQRISVGSRKKRLPNCTSTFIRRDALPLGSFTKYTWQIVNILHVKQIFDTPEMPLDITRSFVENRDGTYDLYEVPRVSMENTEDGFKGKNPTPIRPFELKTFLKVGTTTADQKEPTPFIIEWIPDILPTSRIGELRIKFEYGHQRNGQIEQRVWLPSQDLPMQTIQVQEIG